MSLYNPIRNNGFIEFRDDGVHEIVMAVSDLSGSVSVVRFMVRSKKPDRLMEASDIIDADTVVLFPYNKENIFVNKEISVAMPHGSLYDTIWFQYKELPKRRVTFSDIHRLHLPEIPVHNKFSISINASSLPAYLRPKAMIARFDREGDLSPAGGYYENGFVTTETNLFDGFAIVVDSIPPTIKLIKDRHKHKTALKFKVSDNLSGIEKYYGEINGKWALVSWDPKNKLMEYNYDERLKKGKNLFSLYVSDAKGNKSVFRTSVLKK
jgi:hypothetical protein